MGFQKPFKMSMAIHGSKNVLGPLQFKRPWNLNRLEFWSETWGFFIVPMEAHLVQFWAKSEMVPMESLVELAWNDPTATFSCFPNLSASNIGDWAPFAFYISYFWNVRRTCATSWFLASDAHILRFITLHNIIYVFEGDANWRKRDWPQHFQVKLFSCTCCISVEEWICVYSIFCHSTFETTLIWCRIYQVSLA